MGQVSIGLIRELLRKKVNFTLFLRDSNPETEQDSQELKKALDEITRFSESNHSFKDSFEFDIWHLHPSSLPRLSERKSLLSFYELDSPTPLEINAAKNQDILYFSSQYSCDVFEDAGLNNVKYLPLFFDSFNFRNINKQYFSDGRITFNLSGKFEHRKHHKKIIQSWVKRFGNDKKYQLQCAVFNPFLSEDQNKQLFADSLCNKDYFNVQFLPFMEKNKSYNDFLNSGDVIIGMSGGEGWGLPEFQSVGIGKHSVILNAHSYKEWATEENSCLVEPSGKIDVYDDMFFKKGTTYNQGQIFNWTEESFIDGCERAIEKTKNSRTNKAGKDIKETFTISNTVDLILKEM